MLASRWAEFLKLHGLLLSIGGYETCFPYVEEDMANILARGRYYGGFSKMMKGKPSRCHENACNLWTVNKDKHDVHIATGYALSADGMWRQHSWLVQRYQTATQHRTRIIETTEKRVAYFGYEMGNEFDPELGMSEAEEFCYWNYL